MTCDRDTLFFTPRPPRLCGESRLYFLPQRRRERGKPIFTFSFCLFRSSSHYDLRPRHPFFLLRVLRVSAVNPDFIFHRRGAESAEKPILTFSFCLFRSSSL